MHQLLTARQADTYRPFQDLESKKLLYDLYTAPNEFPLHLRRYANSGYRHIMIYADNSNHVRSIWATDSNPRSRCRKTLQDH
jgi:hypothetical protein